MCGSDKDTRPPETVFTPPRPTKRILTSPKPVKTTFKASSSSNMSLKDSQEIHSTPFRTPVKLKLPTRRVFKFPLPTTPVIRPLHRPSNSLSSLSLGKSCDEMWAKKTTFFVVDPADKHLLALVHSEFNK